MERSKVYFSNLRATQNMNLLQKLERLIKKAGIEQIDFKEKYVAIKVHFGEPGNLAYLRPNYAKVVADVIKGLGGKPFLTDCNTLYVGRRKDALEHLDAAYENGYNPFTTGCQIIIGDGLKGTDEAYVPIPAGEHVKEAKIGRAVMDADVVISLNHFKGHELTGFGGALKNIGMGCGSRAGKMEMHSEGKPRVISAQCVACGACLKICAHGAISIQDKKAKIDHTRCVGCGRCIGTCRFNAIGAAWDESTDILNKKIAEYTWAVLHDRPHFHINMVIDLSPFCDCHAENDAPILPDIGMFASFDPVALDVACADMANQAPALPDSYLSEQMKNRQEDCVEKDHFCVTHPETNWRSCMDHAEKIGIGQKAYELIKV
ncbi:DUF362 domain-containing protein [Propionispora hippei]|uniref:4Fe-4S ferredoxin-type domain-containing protein n=1 Tax=Propionispora hippei DSM 15287 TaxID=1123003 RepID=A0A1M6KIG7_9FIRM|nr:DUF362 domain-containing protein [Propionispora hippei]SHJ58690.1 hypothetical protein SAMN02745170_02872 [Propionispora hippei DSM 15287]